MIDIRPHHAIGYINPVVVSDFIHYQFDKIFPPDVLLTNYHLNLQSFTAEGVDKALEAFWPAFDFLVARQVARISLGGIPLSAFAGRPRILATLEEARRRSSIPSSTDFEDSLEAIRHLRLRRVAVAAKWDETLLRAVTDYVRAGGIEVLGMHGHTHTAGQVIALRADESVDIALALGREAFAQMPDADGLLMAGGAWLVMQAVPMLEAEFGRPVITNPGATYWTGLRQLGLKPRQAGFGRLLDSLL